MFPRIAQPLSQEQSAANARQHHVGQREEIGGVDLASSQEQRRRTRARPKTAGAVSSSSRERVTIEKDPRPEMQEWEVGSCGKVVICSNTVKTIGRGGLRLRFPLPHPKTDYIQRKSKCIAANNPMAQVYKKRQIEIKIDIPTSGVKKPRLSETT